MIKLDFIMGMLIKVEIRDKNAWEHDIRRIFDFFKYVDQKYSPFRNNSEVGRLNRGKIGLEECSKEFQSILKMAESTKVQTGGYFDVKKPDGKIDPSGIVKGWSIHKAAKMLKDIGYKKFYIDAGGDAEIVGRDWAWGIRNPFNKSQNIKVLNLTNCGIATSGTYERGNHIYNPLTGSYKIPDILSITVIGPDVYEADRFATSAFAMGRSGISFIENLDDFEGYSVDKKGIATLTSSFHKYEGN